MPLQAAPDRRGSAKSGLGVVQRLVDVEENSESQEKFRVLHQLLGKFEHQKSAQQKLGGIFFEVDIKEAFSKQT